MDYGLIIRPEAKSDLLNAFHWYQKQKLGLGHDFKLCADEAISKFHRNPLIHQIAFQGIRRSVTKRFPFGIFCTVENQRIILLAVLHARRGPIKRKSRI